MWHTKYASAIPKNLGFDFRPCSKGDFLMGHPQSMVYILQNKMDSRHIWVTGNVPIIRIPELSTHSYKTDIYIQARFFYSDLLDSGLSQAGTIMYVYDYVITFGKTKQIHKVTTQTQLKKINVLKLPFTAKIVAIL